MVLTELFLSAFVTLFVVIDPPGCAPIYAGLTKGATPQQARSMALRATWIASIILLIFALFGQELLGALHIELNSFRIAGGLMLFFIAFDMVFEKRTERREQPRVQAVACAVIHRDRLHPGRATARAERSGKPRCGRTRAPSRGRRPGPVGAAAAPPRPAGKECIDLPPSGSSRPFRRRQAPPAFQLPV